MQREVINSVEPIDDKPGIKDNKLKIRAYPNDLKPQFA